MRSLQLSPANRDFLVKLCGMLGSEHDGERAAAALKASNFLRERTLTWNEVIQVLGAQEPIQHVRPATAKDDARRTVRSIDWRADLAMCRNCRLSLTHVERDFIDALAQRRHRPSESDATKLAQMATRLRTDYRRSWSGRASAADGTSH